MYLEHFGFRSRPFEVTPDPQFLFDGVIHREALAGLIYGVQERRGFISLVGEVGTGKTTLLRTLLDGLDPSVRTILITHTTVDSEELLQMILAELEIPTAGATRVEMLHRLQEFLLDRLGHGETTVLIIDEAQNLSPAVLEEVRLLTNLETGEAKLLQVILAGQPELERTLARPELRQLRQRIAVRARVGPLTFEETQRYIKHRLLVAGRRRQSLFTSLTLEAIWKASGGVPRLINLLCDHCLVTAFASGVHQVRSAMVKEAVQDLGLCQTSRPGWQEYFLRFLQRLGVVTAALGMLVALEGTWSPYRTAAFPEGATAGPIPVEWPNGLSRAAVQRPGWFWLKLDGSSHHGGPR